jgi:hypothetical protein
MTPYYRLLVSILSALLLTAFLGCGGGNSTVATPSTHIYAAGFVTNNAGLTIATYWIDGKPTSLGIGIYSSYATSIVVSGNDVYVAGVEGNGTNDVAKYWKNGKAVALTDGTQRGFAKSIAVSGNDVYVAGGEQTGSNVVARYWKNRAPVSLKDLGHGALAQSIFVSGSDVYVAGWEGITTQIGPSNVLHTQAAAYWKNGGPAQLTDGTALAEANSIFVSGTDVFVAGFACHDLAPDCSVATYWKNGASVQLTNLSSTGATSIFVSAPDIYVSGNQSVGLSGSFAQFWKNTAPVGLTASPSGSAANQVVVSAKDVYVGGAVLNDSGQGVATYWKNGVPVSLTDGTHSASIYGLSVVER